jgi:hypothetical protein
MGLPAALAWLVRIVREARAVREDRGDPREDDAPRRADDEEDELEDIEDEEEGW